MKIVCPKCGHTGQVPTMPNYPQCPKCGYKAEHNQNGATRKVAT